MASARNADTFELESPFAEDFDALDEQDVRLGPEAFDETPFTGESPGEPEPDVERMLRLPGRFDDPKRDAAIDKDGTKFAQFLRGRSRHQFAQEWLAQRPRLAEAAREPQADLTAGAISKAWFVIHDVGVDASLGDKRFKAADTATKNSSVHGFVNRGGYYAATHDLAKNKMGTVYEFLSRKGKKLVGGLTINIETVPDIEKDVPDRNDGTHGSPSLGDRYASIGFRRRPGKKVSYYKWTHGAFDTLADLYILASVRAGHLLTITAHKEMDRNLGRSVIWREYSGKEIRDATNKFLKKARDKPSDYHGDPFAFDVQALYDCITRKLNALGGLQMPQGARYGVHPLRLRRADGADVGNGDSQLHEFPHQSDPQVKTDTKLKKSGWWADGAKSEAEGPAGVSPYQPRWAGADDEVPSSSSGRIDFEDSHVFEDADSEAALRDEGSGEPERLDWGSDAAAPLRESPLHEFGEAESLAWLDVEEAGEQAWEAEKEFDSEGEGFEAEYDTAHEAKEEEYEWEEPESFEPETFEDSESEGRFAAFTGEADSLTAEDETLDAFADFEEETSPKDKVDDFLVSRRSLYKIALVGENVHINLARDAWTKDYTNRALTEGGVGAALNAIYMGGVTAARVEKVFAHLAGTGVKYTPDKRMEKGEGVMHAIQVSPAALDGLGRALNLTRKDMTEAWRLRFGETAFLEFALRNAFFSFDQLVPHFLAKTLAAKRMSVELIKRLIDKHPGSVIEVAKRHPAAAAWRAAFKRNLALHWAEREPQVTDLDRWTWAQWAKVIFELTAATRDTLNAQILRQREEDRKHARNEHLRPHEIVVDDAAKFILENYEPTHQEKLHTTFWIVHGGLQLTNIKGEPIFLLRMESSRVIYQHIPTKKFYQQTLEGFGDEQLYGIYAEAGRKSVGAIALGKWVIGVAGAVFPVVRYGLMATDVLNAAFKLKHNQAALESSYESIKLAYGNIDKLLPGVLPKIWDAVLDKRNVALFNPLQNPDPGAWLKVVIRLVMLRQARVVSGSYASEAVTGFLNNAWKAIKTGLSALWEVIKHVIVLGPAVVGSTGVSGGRALAMAKERLKQLRVPDPDAIMQQVQRLSKVDLERLSREVKDLVANSTKLIDIVRESLSW